MEIGRVGEYAERVTYFGVAWGGLASVNPVVVDSPEGVKSIGEFAFFQCKSLTTVSYPRRFTYWSSSLPRMLQSRKSGSPPHEPS